MNSLPTIIKQHGFIATRKGDIYAVEYISSGHVPVESYFEFTAAEMQALYLDNSKFDELALKAKQRMSNG